MTVLLASEEKASVRAVPIDAYAKGVAAVLSREVGAPAPKAIHERE